MAPTSSPSQPQDTTNQDTTNQDSSSGSARRGLSVNRHFTTAGVDPFSSFNFVRRPSRIGTTSGASVFEMAGVEVPEEWDQVATDILASKYLRKTGVPQYSIDGTPIMENGSPVLGSETSLKQAASRLALAWKTWGEKGNYFASTEDAQAFYDEMVYMLCTQMAAPNSPVWFNVGLFEAYGIIQSADGSWYYDENSEETKLSAHRYERAGASACYISAVKDELVGEGSIFDFVEREARLFSQGSGSGANLSNLRATGEPLTAGGTSSGVLSFMKVLDAAAGAIKSGGSTRRAAKMVILDADHPEIEDYIWAKAHEEKKAAALIAAGYDGSYEGEAVRTVAFQNANHSVRITKGFMQALADDAEWPLLRRTDGTMVRTVPARRLWREIAEAAWECADPGLQFDDILNDWNTAADTERVRGTNPCSEYVHVDDTACNLASLNLVKFFSEDGVFNVNDFEYAVRLWTIALEITVSMSHYPAAVIAKKSFEHRTLGLGYANLGALLMRAGLPYDSPEARATMGAITALMHNRAYATSADLAAAVGPARAYPANSEAVARVLRNHRRAAYGSLAEEHNLAPYEKLTIEPVGVDHFVLERTPFANLSRPVMDAADAAQAGVIGPGYRNMQVTVLAPTGCLEATSIVTTDHGLAPLESLGDPDGPQWQTPLYSDLMVLTDDGSKAASQFYVNGVADVAIITTDHGRTMRGTPEHRVRTVSETGEWAWTRLADIRDGDVVPVAPGLTGDPREVVLPPPVVRMDSNTIPTVMTPALAELVGYFRTAGYIHPGTAMGFVIDNIDPTVELHLSALLLEVFGIGAVVTVRDESSLMEINSPELTTWWDVRCQFAPRDFAGAVPSLVLATNDPAVYGSYIRGLFEADALVDNGAVFTFDTVFAAAEFLSMLTALKVRALFDEVAWTVTVPADSLVRFMRNANPSSWANLLRISSRGLVTAAQAPSTPNASQKWQSLDLVDSSVLTNEWAPLSPDILASVTPLNHSDQAALDTLLTQVEASRHPSLHILVSRTLAERLFTLTLDPDLANTLHFFYDIVVGSSRLDGSALTYDLSVPENVTYVANGFVSHNTIGLVMSCDTTGVEPDFALVKMKKLAGGGYMRIINSSVPTALKTLGYSPAEVERCLTWALGSQTLFGDTPVSATSLLAAGLDPEEVESVQKELANVSDLTWAFSPHIVSTPLYERFGSELDGQSLLLSLGFTAAQINESSLAICGHLTLEGSPYLKPEHQAVFDCAVECGSGTRSIQWSGHVAALAAVAPHISGSVSKTVNLPNSATVADIENAHLMAYESGVKCVAIYRDGSKVAQPLASAGSSSDEGFVESDAAMPWAPKPLLPGMSPSQYYEGHPVPRFRPPNPRFGPTWRIEIGGEELYLHAGVYEDGSPAEIFVDWGRQGSLLRGMTSALSIAVSHALQRGMPLEDLIKAFRGQTFEPNGIVTGHANLKMTSSVTDAIVRILGHHFLGRDDLVQVPGPPAVMVHQGPPIRPELPFPKPPMDEVDKAHSLLAQGVGQRVYGLTCSICGGGNLFQAGTCHVCGDCGETTGCS